MDADTAERRPLILVTDDDRGMRDMLKLVLGLEGYSVVLASTGDEALHMAGVHQVDLLLVDVHMPGLSGLDLGLVYRNQGGTAPIILLTGARLSPETATDHYASDVIRKPFVLGDLLATVARHLGTP